jgi:glycosyltransferase involved in cell wall biosynthesis
MEDAKKILMISYTSFIQKFYQTLPHKIARQSGWELTVLVPPYWKELWSGGKKYLEKSEDELFDLVTGNILFAGNLHLAIFRSQLKRLLRKIRPDIIDLEDEPFNLGSFQTIFYRNRYSPQSKVILHASQHQYKNYPIPFNFIEKYVLKQTDAILARNEMAMEVLRKKGYQGILKKITHGVNTDAFRPRDLPELCGQINPENKPLVGYVGALEIHKGLHHLIQAAEGLHCKLLFVGDGSYKKELTDLVYQTRLDAQFVPSSTHEEVAQFMNCMDIFVLPSLTMPNWVEKFGRVLIEAMSSGIAVIGSSSGEIPQVIGDAGLVFKECNIADLQKKLNYLILNKKKRNELGWKGRKQVQQKYSWNHIAGETILAYQEVLDKKIVT